MHYRVRVDPQARQLSLSLTLARKERGDISLAVPTWVPGAYAFMRYGRDVFDLGAEDVATGEHLRVERDGFSGFRIKDASPEVRVTAKISAADGAWGELVGFVEPGYAVIRASHFPFDVGHDGPCKLSLELPEGWAIHHPGGALRDVGEGTPTFQHRSHESLVDTPVVCGAFDRLTRSDDGATFHVVFLTRAVGHEREVEAFVDDLMVICRATKAIFGSYPFDEYTFVVATDPRHSFGLEHAHATLVGFGDLVFIDREARATALRLAAHELFHAWNVCRLRPAALMKPDFVAGSFPDGLWISEGVTRYYELLLAARTGVFSVNRFLSNLVRYDDAIRVLPASRHVSLADSSKATFLNHNRFPGSTSATLDYYDKGLLVAFAIDACLRTAQTPSSLDRAFAAFYEEFVGRGFSTEEAIQFFHHFASPRLPRVPLGPMLQRIVVGSDIPETSLWLEALGFAIERETRPMLGVWLKADRGPGVLEVLAESPAAKAGLLAGDELVAVNGFAFRPEVLSYVLAAGEPFDLEVRSGNRYRVLTVAPKVRELASLLRVVEPSSELRSWLGEGASTLAPGTPIPLNHYDNFHVAESML
ncbi:MAG: M61 family metallopeptidase [Myxococcales bacterium]|nr:M61 family metallopeptidase [Myxococcales bacterium]